MRSPARPSSLLLYRLLLGLVSRFVAASQRSEWLAEWNTELWYVAQALANNEVHRHFHQKLAKFCFGAISDLRCVKRLHSVPATRPSRSALACLAWLALALLVSVALVGSSEKVLQETRPSLYSGDADLVAIAPAGLSQFQLPSMPLRTLRAWQRRRQHLFSEFTFFQPITKAVHIGPHNSPELTIGRSAPNLLTLLRVPVSYEQTEGARSSLPVLMLSETTWKTRFASSPEIFGRSYRVGLDLVRIGGVVPDDTAPAGSQLDAWLLLPQASTDALVDSTRVFLVARAAPHSQLAKDAKDFWHMSVPGDDLSNGYDCSALSTRHTGVLPAFFWMLCLAILSLPALTPLSASEHGTHRVSISYRRSFRRWGFMVIKSASLIGLSLCSSLLVAYALPWRTPEVSVSVFLAGSFVFLLASLHWSLRDQAQRCPICLSKLQCPARVGQPSRNFLTWNGTELICTSGHGLLHVPEIPTSWFSEPRWLSLDASWDGLFLQPA